MYILIRFYRIKKEKEKINITVNNFIVPCCLIAVIYKMYPPWGHFILFNRYLSIRKRVC